MDASFSRAYGALAGLALGDALGMPTQALSPADIVRLYGRVSSLVDASPEQPYAPLMPAGSVTDDTEQALLVASLLLRGQSTPLRVDASDFAHSLLAWEDSMIARGSLDLLGPSTKAALERVRAGEDPLTVGGEGTTNGAAMRVTPIGIAVSTNNPRDFAEAVWSSCQVTHATRQGFRSAALVAAAVSLGIEAAGADAVEILHRAVDYVDSLPTFGAWSPEVDVVGRTRYAMDMVDQGLSCEELPGVLRAHVGCSVASAEAIPAAFALAAWAASSPYEALVEAANLGGDTDTIGAIAGAILGGICGVSVFPREELERIEEVCHLGVASVAADLLALRSPSSLDDIAAQTRQEDRERTRGTTHEEDAERAGRVVLVGQILVDQALRGSSMPAAGEDVWAQDAGSHAGGGINALVAARRMGVHALSLSPIGEGPHASLILDSLQREGIGDAGPRVEGMDNGYCIAFTDERGERTFISTRGAETHCPADAWADALSSLSPSDVVYVDGYLMDHPDNREAVARALRALPEGVRLVLDVSPVLGLPQDLPTQGVIVSMNRGEAAAILERFRKGGSPYSQASSCASAASAYTGATELGPEEDARTVCELLGRTTVVRCGAQGAYLARPEIGGIQVTHIPTPRIDVVDTNGAGDAHSGVLAASLALGIPLDRGLVLANCAGALASTHIGPATCPQRDIIEATADSLLSQ